MRAVGGRRRHRTASVAHTFNGMFVADLMGHVLKLAAYVAVSLTLVYSRQYLLDRGLLRGEFFALLLFALLGMMVMIERQQLPHAVPRPGAAVAVPVCAWWRSTATRRPRPRRR